MRVRIPVPSRLLTRRETLTLGAGAAAIVVLRHPAAALARPSAFEMALPETATGTATASGDWRTLPVARAPRRFDLVGLRWSSGKLDAVEIRARRRTGDWCPWTRVGPMGDHAPDASRARRGTDAVWTGAADLVQVRVRGGARGLRARFVRSPSPAGPRAGAARAPRARSGQAVPPIIPRSEWGGDGRPPKADPSYGEVQCAFVHHTVTANDYGPEDSASIVLGICKYHQDHNRWNDIGYNFLVDKYGQIFEGRAGGVELAVIGAQAQGYNSSSTGIACMGDFSSLPNSEAGLESLARLIAWKLPLHGVPVTGEVTVTSAGGEANRYPSGTPVTLQRIAGHRDGNKTSCPGAAMYGQLQRVRDRAAQLAVPASLLSARAARPTVRHPSPVSLSGTLRFSDGAPASAVTIELQHRAAGGAWSPVGSTRTAANGAWAFRTAAPATGELRAVFPGDGTHPPLESAPIAVTVLPRVTIALGTRSSAPGAKVDVTGTVGPTWPAKVALVLEVRRGGRWEPVQRKRINVRGGRFASFVRPRASGLYRVSVEGPGTVVRRQLRVSSVAGGTQAG